MKKIIIILFIFCPILGFFRATFFSEENGPNFHVPKNEHYFSIVAYYPSGLSKAITMKSCVIYKTSLMKSATMVVLTEEGFIEKKTIGSFVELSGAYPIIEYSGSQADRAISSLDGILKRYPFISEVEHFVGPNQNTLTAHILRKLKVNKELPSNCAGKDYIGSGLKWIYQSHTSQFMGSFSGFIGISASKDKVELQILGLVLGYNWEHQRLLLPGFGDLEIGDIITYLKAKI
jgi:hypothetical protein